MMKSLVINTRILLCLSVAIFFDVTSLFSEGSKQLSPTANDRVNLAISGFGTYDGPADERLYIHIENPDDELVYLGFSQPSNYGNWPCDAGLCCLGGEPVQQVNGYFRIKDPNGNVVYGPQVIDAKSSMSSWSQAAAGPSQIVGKSGYNAFSFDPSGMPAGDYYVEFSRNANSPGTAIYFEWWDITVADQILNTAIDGRVYSKQWAFYAPDTDCNSSSVPYGGFDRSFVGKFCVYSETDGIVTKVDFNGSGLQPAFFNVFFNNFGTSNTGNVVIDRKSVANTQAKASFYPLFLNDPDETAFPSGNIGSYAGEPFLASCDGTSGDFFISVTEPGQLEILVDIHEPGKFKYTPGTADVSIAVKVVPQKGEKAPYVRPIPWNGKDGLGKQVNLNEPFDFMVNYTQGIFHFPIYDSEYMLKGFTFETVRPLPPPKANPVNIYFDDSNIPFESGTGSPKTELNGCLAPCHTWNNFDYGNVNTINTWFFGSEDKVLKNETAQCFAEAVDDHVKAFQNEAKVIDIINNDNGLYIDIKSLTGKGVKLPQYGTILNVNNKTGEITYKSNDYFIGEDSFEYIICDTTGYICDTATVYVTVEYGACMDPLKYRPNCDFDGDGITNIEDLDDDNDGILDTDELPSDPLVDNDFDGIPAYLDDDDKSAKIGDDNLKTEEAFDYDGDGIPNSLDLDSDGDGCLDAFEAGHNAKVYPNGMVVLHPFEVGKNGLANDLETTTDNGRINYKILLNLKGSASEFLDDQSSRGCNHPPEITYAVDVNFPENSKKAVIDIQSIDDRDKEDGSLNYRLVNGTDILDFNIDPVSGLITFNSPPDFEDPDDSNTNNIYEIEIEVCDTDTIDLCDTASISVTVLDINEAPVIQSPNILTIEEDSGPNEICTFFGDEDSKDTHSSGIIQQPKNGKASSGVRKGGQICMKYEPNENFNGKDRVAVVVCDNNALCDTVYFEITILEANDPPLAMNDEVDVPEDAVDFGINPSLNDNDDLDKGSINVASIQIISDPKNGGAKIGKNKDKPIEYSPDPNFNGLDSLTYRICDNGSPIPALCDTATIYITVVPANDPPEIMIPPVTVRPEDGPPSVVCTPYTDLEENDTHKASICDVPSHGNASLSFDKDEVCITYFSDPEFSGLDTVCVQVCDQSGACDTTMFIMKMDPVNDPPVAIDDRFEVAEDTEAIIDVQNNDSDIEGNPFSTSIIGRSVSGVELEVLDDDSISYTPFQDFVGFDTFYYEICEIAEPLLCDTAMVVVEVKNINDKPVLSEVPLTVMPEDATEVFICSDISDPDKDDVHVFTMCSFPAHSNNTIISIQNGQICALYTPLPNYNGPDSICVVVCDKGGLCDTITFQIEVTPVNDAPVAVNDNIDGIEDSPIYIDVQDNDYDIDEDAITTRILGPSSLGVLPVVLNGDSIEYALPRDYIGVDTFYYEICDIPLDGDPLCDTARVIVNVMNANDPPEITVPPVTIIPEDTTDVTVCTPYVDVDIDDSHTVSICDENIEGKGSVDIVNGEICLTFTPTPDFYGETSICVAVCDFIGACDSVNIPFLVTPVNDAPIAIDDEKEGLEDTPITVNVQENDITSPDDDELTTRVLGPSTQGVTPSVMSNDSIVYTSPQDFVGLDTFFYEVCDSGNPTLCDTAMVVMEINNVNDYPELITPKVTALEEDSDELSICVDYTDPDLNDTHTVEICGDPINGTANAELVKGQVCINYTPNEDYNGLDSICVKICDESGLCDSTSVLVNITPVNDPPLANDDSPNGLQDTPITIDVQNNDEDIDGDPFTTSIVTQGEQGGFVEVIDGDSISYTPPPGFVGLDKFTYEICDDGNPALCDTAVVVVNVGNVNDPPVINDPAITSLEEDAEDVVICTPISDPDIGDVHTANICEDPENGSATAEVVNGKLCIKYTPDEDYNGMDVICIEVCDFEGLCDQAEVSVIITPVNDTPYAELTYVPTLPEDTSAVTFCMPIKDVDSEDTHSVSICGNPSHGEASVDMVNGDLCLTYEPNPNFFGEVEVCVEVCDNNGACSEIEIPIVVTPVNDPPFAFNDAASTLEDVEVSLEAKINDLDTEGDNLYIQSVSESAKGATPVIIGTDSISYTPPLGFVGLDTFTYNLCDDGSPVMCDETFVVITVINVNDAPQLAEPEVVEVPEDTTDFEICISIEDPDQGDQHTPSICEMPSNGVASVNIENNELCIVYTPNTSYNGQDSICIKVCDLEGECDSVMIPIIVTPVNDKPDAVDDIATTLQDTPVTIDVQANDFDVEDDYLITYILMSSSAGSGEVKVIEGDSVTYTPPLGFVGLDTVTYVICDTGVPSLCDTAQIVINVLNVNDPPLLEDVAKITLSEDSDPYTVCTPIIDPDLGDIHEAKICDAPENGHAEVEVIDGQVCMTYEPNVDYFGPDQICIAVCDAEGLCDSIEMEIEVLSVNDAPIAQDDYVEGYQDTPLIANLKDNDSDPEDDVLIFLIIGSSTKGVFPLIHPGDSMTYTPPSGFVGLDTVTYKICDTGNPSLCDTAIVIINVQNVNDAPEIDSFDPIVIPEDTSSVTICTTFSDPDKGDSHEATICGEPNNGIAGVLISNGMLCIQYTPEGDFEGVDEICISVCDEAGACDNLIVPITVSPINDAPIAEDDKATTWQDQKVFIDVQNNDSDIDGDDLITNFVFSSTSGSQSIIVGNDSLIYIPANGFVGIDTFTYQICDGGDPNLCDVAVIEVEVLNVNDEPEIIDPGVITIDEDNMPEEICLEFIDPDIGDTHSVEVCGEPENGSGNVTLNGTSICYTYTPENDFNGIDFVCLKVCDASGECDSILVKITVSPINDMPVAEDDEETTLQDQSVVIYVQENDEDIDGDELITNIIGESSEGIVPVVIGDDSIRYTPPVGFVGVDMVTYEICDDGGLCDTAVVTIIVENVNDTPEIIDPGVTEILEDGDEVVICAEINDPDPNELHQVELCEQPQNGQAEAAISEGSVCISYQPNDDYNGSDEVCIIVCDADGACDTLSIQIEIESVNDAPVAEDDYTFTIQDLPTEVNVIDNDDDVDNDDLTLTLLSSESEEGGTLTLTADDVVKYVPADGFHGTDMFLYEICDDGTPSLCDTAEVIIDVIFENDLPEVKEPETLVIKEDTTIVSICTEITDPDTRDIHTALICDQPDHGLAFVGIENRDLCLAYQPVDNFNGEDSVCVIVCDPFGGCDTVVFNILVESVNDKPIAEDDSITTLQNQMISVNVQNNDFDIDGDDLETSIIGTGHPNSTIQVINGDSLIYTPPLDYAGLDTVTYQICDSGNPVLCDVGIVIVTIENINDEPAFLDTITNVSMDEDDDPIEICLDFYDPDSGDNHMIEICDDPENGKVSAELHDDKVCVTYEPKENFHGEDNTCIVICDNEGTCDTTYINIFIESKNDAPFADDDIAVTIQDESIEIDVQKNDSDIDGDDISTTRIIGTSTEGVTPFILSGNRILYTPPSAFVGVDSFKYEICDSANPALCDIATVVINVVFENDAPVIVPFDQIDIPEDTSEVILCTVIHDPDPGQTHGASICEEPKGGEAEVSLANGELCVSYTPNKDFFGEDSICIEVCDQLGACTSITIPIVVDARNDHPTAVDDNVTIFRDQSVIIDVQLNDFDADGDDITTSLVGLGTQMGTVEVVNGNHLQYTPPPLFLGKDTLTYWICDEGNPALCDVAEVVVNVVLNPSLADPDLFPNFTFGRTTFQTNDESIVIVNINEINNSATHSPTKFFIPNSSGFAYTFDSELSLVDVFGPQSVQNSEWSATVYPTGTLFETDEYIDSGDRSRIALNVKAITPGTKAHITVNIAQGSGGEINEVNNVAVLSISVQN